VRQVLEEVGAVDAVERHIDELTASAMAALERARLVAPATAELTALAERATKRIY
jgi:geranylgeranyl diphosphate synthase type I